MRNRLLIPWVFVIAVIMLLNSCDKRSGEGGCVLLRSVYSNGIPVAFSFISKDSVNLLTTKEVQAKDIDLKYGNSNVDTVLLYKGNEPGSLKYVSFWGWDNTGENSLIISVKGVPHTLSFTHKLVPGGCAGPKQDLSNFKVDGQAVEPVLVSEPLYVFGSKRNINFLKLYIVL